MEEKQPPDEQSDIAKATSVIKNNATTLKPVLLSWLACGIAFCLVFVFVCFIPFLQGGDPVVMANRFMSIQPVGVLAGAAVGYLVGNYVKRRLIRIGKKK